MSFLFKDKVHDIIKEQRAQRTPGRQASPGMHCLVVGSGGREHAIVWRLLLDRQVGAIDAVPGNAGTAVIARNVDSLRADDAHRIALHAVNTRIDLAVVGPDEGIAAGVADELRRAGVPTVGASREAGRIEWSKSFAKELMERAGVPTARWWTFDDLGAFAQFAADLDRPVAVKADGLAAGKGVVLAENREETVAAARAALEEGRFGAAGKRIVVEELLEGEEVSLQALVDGETVIALPTSRDYKRAGDGDSGPNTGGMGAYSPSSRVADAEAQALADRFIAPIARALAQGGTPFRGILYAGLLFTADGPYALEYNARFGDPEAEVVLPRLGGDFSALMLALAEGRLAEHCAAQPLEIRPQAAVDVVVSAVGYPGTAIVGETIQGLLDIPAGTLVFHSGTRRLNDSFVTSGGRVLHVVGRGETLASAREAAYAGVERIRFPSAFHRRDIAAVPGEVRV
jgi:phosphoribosylamine--glycine ligase